MSVSCHSAISQHFLKNLQGHSGQVCSVAVLGDLVVSGGRDKAIKLWSRSSAACLTTLTECEDQVYGLALKGTLLLSGEGGKGGKGAKGAKVRLWSVSDKSAPTRLAVFAEHTGPVWSVSFADTVARRR